MKRLSLNMLVIAACTCAHLQACPFCESEIGARVNAGIFNGDFAKNAGLILLPAPVFIFLVSLIHFGLPWPKKGVPDTDFQESHSRNQEE